MAFALSPHACESRRQQQVHDTGWVSLAVTTQEKQHYLHESLFIWGGWSLVADRPGKTVSQGGKPAADITNVSGRRIPGRARRGTLPSLRFGVEYRFKAAAVDLGGRRMDIGIEADAVSRPETFRRFDPVASPLVIARENLEHSPGQTVLNLVIRSGDDPESWRTSQRHVVPPPIDITLAEWHGLLDNGGNAVSTRAYERICRAASAPPTTTNPHFHHRSRSFDVTYEPDPLAEGVTFFGLPNQRGALEIPFGTPARSFRIRLDGGVGSPHWNESDRVLTGGLAARTDCESAGRVPVASRRSQETRDVELDEWSSAATFRRGCREGTSLDADTRARTRADACGAAPASALCAGSDNSRPSRRRYRCAALGPD